MTKPKDIEQWLQELVSSHTPAKGTHEERILALAQLCQRLRSELNYYAMADRLYITHPMPTTGSIRIKTEKADHGTRARRALEYFPDGVL